MGIALLLPLQFWWTQSWIRTLGFNLDRIVAGTQFGKYSRQLSWRFSKLPLTGYVLRYF